MDYEEAAEVFGLDALHPVDGTAVLLPLDTLRELMAYADASPDEVASGVYVAHGTGLDGGALAESFVWDNRPDADGLHRVPAAIAEDVAALAAGDGRAVDEVADEVAESALEEVDERMAAALADVRTSLLDHLAELLAPAVDGRERDLEAIDAAVARMNAAMELAEIVDTCYVDWSGLLESPQTLAPGELHDQEAYRRIALNSCERQVMRPSPSIEEFYRDVLAPVPGGRRAHGADDLDSLAGVALAAAEVPTPGGGEIRGAVAR